MEGLRIIARLAGAQLRMSVLAALQYRVGFWTEGVLGVAWSLLGLVPLLVAMGHRPEIAGWGPWEVILVTGCFTVVSGIFGAMLSPALIASMDHIRRGTLDYLLLRPADALALCLLSELSPWRLTEVVFGLAMIVLALIRVGVTPDALAIAKAIAAFLAGLVALYALGILALCASFRALQLQNLVYLYEAGLDFARWPASVFRGVLKAVFTFLVPFAVMTTYPAEGLLGRLSPWVLLQAWATAAALVVVARGLWRRSLRSYSSASS
ncbi:MAG: ABC-2 family transporter protein [Nannocystaceae bacterium]